jgi:2',3'-cyclic-nucleotide 3'-phosphodiesterase
MPGASLWIIPPKDSSFSQALQTLISKTIPPHFPQTKTHEFIPHVTITSNINQSLYGSNHQAWLSDLHLPSGDQHDPVFVTLDVLEAGDAFVKKLTMRAGKTAQLLHLASACRAEAVEGGDLEKAEKWAHNEYLPHLSLM